MAEKKRTEAARTATPADHALGAKLRAVRLAAGVSQEALAERVGVTFQQIQKYEKGINRIPVSRLCALAEALDVFVGEFLPAPSDEQSVWSVAATSEGNAFLTALASVKNPDLRRRLLRMLQELVEVPDDKTTS